MTNKQIYYMAEADTNVVDVAVDKDLCNYQ